VSWRPFFEDVRIIARASRQEHDPNQLCVLTVQMRPIESKRIAKDFPRNANTL